MSSLTKDHIVEILESIAQLLELKGENPFKTRAYINAARALETWSGNLVAAVDSKTLHEIPGMGKAITAKVEEMVLTGRLEFYEKLRAEFPPELFDLFELSGLGAKKIKALYENLNIASIEALEAACRNGTVGTLPGFGAKTATNILKAIEERKQFAGQYRLGDAVAEAEAILEHLRSQQEVVQSAIAGSYRRRKEIVHDLDFIAATSAPEIVIQDFTNHPLVTEVLMRGSTKLSVRLQSGIQADLRVVKNAEYPFALNYFTGSKEHNIVMRGRALKHGWTLNEYRFAPLENAKFSPEAIPTVPDEAGVYAALGLPFIEPELREDRGEFAAAEAGTLPRLIELENLRGTFHNHTNASDGRATLEEMADAARDLGLQYLGIADHSKSSFQAHGLDEKRIEAQRKEIAKLNASLDGFRLFSGVECDILKSGDLDFSDEVLASLDYVVASVHAVFNLPEAEMTKRVIKAISNPWVTMLGHATGRLLLSRKGYELDIPAVIEAAAETGTIIELNANPRRLELDWRWWPLAKEKGVKCAVNPDAHAPEHFQYLWYGVAMARKGWLIRDDVVNCLPLGKIEAVLAAKRRWH